LENYFFLNDFIPKLHSESGKKVEKQARNKKKEEPVKKKSHIF